MLPKNLDEKAAILRLEHLSAKLTRSSKEQATTSMLRRTVRTNPSRIGRGRRKTSSRSVP